VTARAIAQGVAFHLVPGVGMSETTDRGRDANSVSSSGDIAYLEVVADPDGSGAVALPPRLEGGIEVELHHRDGFNQGVPDVVDPSRPNGRPATRSATGARQARVSSLPTSVPARRRSGTVRPTTAAAS